MRHRHRTLLVVLPAVAGVCLAAGCSSDPAPAAATTSAPPATNPATSAPSTTISVAPPVTVLPTTIPVAAVPATAATRPAYVLHVAADLTSALVKLAAAFGVTGQPTVDHDVTTIDGGPTGRLLIADPATGSWAYLPGCEATCPTTLDPTAAVTALVTADGMTDPTIDAYTDPFGNRTVSVAVTVDGMPSDLNWTFTYTGDGQLLQAGGTFATPTVHGELPLATDEQIIARLPGRQADNSTDGRAYHGAAVTGHVVALVQQRAADGSMLLIPAVRFTTADGLHYTVPATYPGLFPDAYTTPATTTP